MIENFTKNQKDAIRHFKGPLLIIAGPGAGKTLVLIERVRFLIKEKAVAPNKILLTTFTLKAASELKAKLIKKIGPEAEPVRISNIHSFCHTILDNYSDCHDFGATFDVLDEGMQIMFLRNHLDDLEITEHKFKDIISFYNKCSENCIPPDRLIEKVNKLYPNRNNFLKICRSYKRYLELLEENRKIDFAGLQRIVLNLLEENEEVLEDIRNNIEFILVDEYQDTNPLQDKIFELIAKPKCNICVVGDDDQSIYAFRGAEVENFIKFPEKYPNTKIVRLDTNFRSNANIIDISEEFIKNYRILNKTIKPDREKGNDVILLKNDDDDSEAKEIVKLIKEMKKKQIIPHYGYVTLLFRSIKHDAKKIIKELKEQGLPYTVREDPMFLKREEIRTMLYLLHYVDPNNNYEGRLRRRWGRWWNNSQLETEFINLTPETIKSLHQLGEDRNINSIITSEEFVEIGIFNEDDIGKISRLNKLKKEVPNINQDVLFVFYEILKATGYLKRLLSDENEENVKKLFYLARLSSIINKYNYLSKEASIEDFLKFLHNLPRKLYYDEALSEDHKALKLMTIHQAKGLEFPVVFICSVIKSKFRIIGAQNETLPIPDDLLMNKAKNPKYEEGRIFYVAMTRAQDNLIISSYKNMDRNLIDYSTFITHDIGTDKFSDVNAIISPCEVRENIKDFQNISYSSIQTYEICPALYKINHYYFFETEPTYLQKYGIILHKCLNKLHLAIGNYETINEKKIGSIIDNCWVKIYETETEDEEKKRILTKKLWEYYQINKKNIKKVISTEESFSVNTKDVSVEGRIDLIMENEDGKLELLDFKVSGKKDWQLKEVEHQLKVYRYALNEEYNFDKIAVYHFFDNEKTYFDYNEEDLEETKQHLELIGEKIINGNFNQEKSSYCTKCFFNFCCEL